MKTALTGIPAMPEGMMAELYTITLASGAILYYTTADSNLTYRGQVYLAGAFNLERDTIKTSVGVEVDDVMITVYANGDDTIQGVTLPIFVNNGGFDGAWVKIERARQSYVVHLFEGLVSDANADRTKVDLTISAATMLLNVQMPRNLYSPGCGHTLFDSGCSLVKSSFAYSTAVAYGSDQHTLNCGLTQAAGFFDLGTVTFTSGLNTGVSRTIKVYSTGVITLSYPLPHLPGVGDAFTAYPGCNGTRATCISKFANDSHYRGFPFMPVPEASV